MWLPSLDTAQLACWVLVVATVGAAGSIVIRRRLRRRFSKRIERWRAEVSRELSAWLERGRCPEQWLREGGRRRVLVEALVEKLAPPGSREETRCHQALEQWGVVAEQLAAIRATEGRARAEAVSLLGRMRAVRAIPVLAELLDDPDPDVRLAVVRALGMFACPEAAEPLLARLRHSSPEVCFPALQGALIRCCKKQPQMLLAHLEGLPARRQALLLRVLAEVGRPGLLPRLERFATAAAEEVRAELARALGQIAANDSIHLLVRLAHDPCWFVRVEALRALGQVRGWPSVDLLLEGLNDDRPAVRHAAAESLARQPLAPDELLRLAYERLTPPGRQALLATSGAEGLLLALVEQLGSRAVEVRVRAVGWLRAALAAGAYQSLLQVLHHPDPRVAETVADFLATSGEKKLTSDVDEALRRTAADSPPGHRLVRIREQISLLSLARP